MTDFGDMIYPKAKKDHRCEWCGETILKGEKHAKFSGVWESEFQNWRMHIECHSFASDNDELYEGFTPFEHERVVALEQAGPK